MDILPRAKEFVKQNGRDEEHYGDGWTGPTLKPAGKNIYRFEEFFSMSLTMMLASNLLSLRPMESLNETRFIKAYLLMVGADPQVTFLIL